MKYINITIAILLSLVYASCQIPPIDIFNLWAISLAIPFALILNIILVLIFLFLRRKTSIYYIMALLIGSPHIFSSFGIKYVFHGAEHHADSFTLLSYNLGGFQVVQPNKSSDDARMELKEYLMDSSADIQCYQEFENMPWGDQFNIIKELDEAGVHYYFSQEDETSHSHYSRAGTLIISRFPIVAKGDFFASKNGFNRVSYADIQIGLDTLRIINVHLESMGLGYSKTLSQTEEIKLNTLDLLNKLRKGIFERMEQTKTLVGLIDDSPFPVICAGDFNDLPYTYSYQLMKRRMKNSFEESGKGFGFTYGGSTLRMLRIDNQYYTSPIESTGFETLNDIPFSDHYPLIGEYYLKR